MNRDYGMNLGGNSNKGFDPLAMNRRSGKVPSTNLGGGLSKMNNNKFLDDSDTDL